MSKLINTQVTRWVNFASDTNVILITFTSSGLSTLYIEEFIQMNHEMLNENFTSSIVRQCR